MNTFSPEDWPRVKAIFDQAVGRPEYQRRDYLTSACGGEVELLRQVEALLASHERATGFLEPPPGTGDLTGQTVSGYRVLSRLGAGGMGEVYLAHDEKLDRPVALKLLSTDLRADPVHWQRFHQEARAASLLNHPHIVVVHDVDEIDGRPLMVTEYIEGQTLRARLEQRPLDPNESLELAGVVASVGLPASGHDEGLPLRAPAADS